MSTNLSEPATLEDTLISRIRRGLSIGADRDSLHDAIVPHDASEDDFFLAYQAALVLGDLPCLK